jgi:hypothetical protein
MIYLVNILLKIENNITSTESWNVLGIYCARTATAFLELFSESLVGENLYSV